MKKSFTTSAPFIIAELLSQYMQTSLISLTVATLIFVQAKLPFNKDDIQNYGLPCGSTISMLH